MLLIKAELRASPIEGRGLFTLEPVRKGQVIALFTLAGKIEDTPGLRYGMMREKEYLELLPKDEVVAFSGARLVDDCFVYKNMEHPEDFPNHSNTPNMLYHCGIGFALVDMPAGTELLADYRHFFSAQDYSKLDGEKVYGLPPREALLRSTRALLKLLEEDARNQQQKERVSNQA